MHESERAKEQKLGKNKQIITATLVLAIFLVAIPALTPQVYAAAAPCVPTPASCNINILSPGGLLNSNKTVGPSFLVSFAVANFSLVQPGTKSDVNTVQGTGASAFNEGHIHVWVDNRYVTIWANANGIPLTLFPGTHTIRLDLVNDLHQQFSPPINATTTVNVVNPPADTLQSTVNSAQTSASNAQTYSIGALVTSVITLILVAYIAFRPKPKAPA